MKALEKFFTDYRALVTLSARVKLAQIEDSIAKAEKEFGSVLENTKRRDEFNSVCAKLVEYPHLLKNYPEHVSKFMASYRRIYDPKTQPYCNRVNELLILHRVASSVGSDRLTRAVQKETRRFCLRLVDRYNDGNALDLRPLFEREYDKYNKKSFHLLALIWLYGEKDKEYLGTVGEDFLMYNRKRCLLSSKGYCGYAKNKEAIDKFFSNYRACLHAENNIKIGLEELKRELLQEFLEILQYSCKTQMPLPFGSLCLNLALSPELLENDEAYHLFLSAYGIFKTKRPLLDNLVDLIEEYCDMVNHFGYLAQACPRLKKIAEKEAASVFYAEISILAEENNRILPMVRKDFLPPCLRPQWPILDEIIWANRRKEFAASIPDIYD